MGNLTLTYGAASTGALCALAWFAAAALMQRFGTAPIPAAQGTSASAAAHTPTVDRKADDRVPPRGRPL